MTIKYAGLTNGVVNVGYMAGSAIYCPGDTNMPMAGTAIYCPDNMKVPSAGTAIYQAGYDTLPIHTISRESGAGCIYCGRKAKPETELCESCGAPLP